MKREVENVTILKNYGITNDKINLYQELVQKEPKSVFERGFCSKVNEVTKLATIIKNEEIDKIAYWSFQKLLFEQLKELTHYALIIDEEKEQRYNYKEKEWRLMEIMPITDIIIPQEIRRKLCEKLEKGVATRYLIKDSDDEEIIVLYHRKKNQYFSGLKAGKATFSKKVNDAFFFIGLEYMCAWEIAYKLAWHHYGQYYLKSLCEVNIQMLDF